MLRPPGPLVGLLLVSCAALSREEPQPRAAEDPARAEVRLESRSADWNASLLLDSAPTGIWTVGAYDVFPQYGSPDVVGLDDLGRCHVLVSYSGKWTPVTRVHDGSWLGGLAHADVDPRVPGQELYVGSQSGNLYQLVPLRDGRIDDRWIAHFPGREVHTVVGGELDRQEGAELLVFTSPGGLWRVSPDGEHGRFRSVLLEELDGRVRDATLLPPDARGRRAIATVSRAGALALLHLEEGGPRWETVHQEPMGMGRLALRPAALGEALVLYTTLDDGRVLRHERGPSGWSVELVHAGPQGPRGVAAGRFAADPRQETIAIFGYSREVQLLTRRERGWDVETLFVDRGPGHWLARAELDGRNATDELLASGYGARIVLLARPPGYGRPGAAVVPRRAAEGERR